MKSGPAGKPARMPAGEVRIIGGLWRRSRLPVAAVQGLRPTPDRIRETLFNWLGQDLTGWRVLDAFAGSGALGLEAASRGAASVGLVERDPAVVRVLQANCQRLRASTVTVTRGDGVVALGQQPAASLDLVLLDPPYDSGLLNEALALAAAAVVPGGFVYAEADARKSGAPVPAALELWRSARAGQVAARLYRRLPQPAAIGQGADVSPDQIDLAGPAYTAAGAPRWPNGTPAANRGAGSGEAT